MQGVGPSKDLSTSFTERFRELDRKTTEVASQLDKFGTKLTFTERLAYDFRKDLAKNMSDIESHFSKRLDQLTRAIQEVSRMYGYNVGVGPD